MIRGAAGVGSTILLPHIRHSRQTHPVGARIFGMRMRLYAVAVNTKNHLTRPRPRCRVLRKPPTVFPAAGTAARDGCKGRLENCLKALLYSADGGRAVARALGRGDRRHARAAARGLRRSSIPQTLRKPLTFPRARNGCVQSAPRAPLTPIPREARIPLPGASLGLSGGAGL